MKYKVGDFVIVIDGYNRWDCIDKVRKGKNLKNEIGRIIAIHKYINDKPYYCIEIISCPYKKKCKEFQKDSYCIYLSKEIKSLNSLKLKKFIEHGV